MPLPRIVTPLLLTALLWLSSIAASAETAPREPAGGLLLSADSDARPAGLTPSSPCPEGVRVTSASDALIVAASTENGELGRRQFIVVVPPSASLSPVLTDYTIAHRAAGVPETLEDPGLADGSAPFAPDGFAPDANDPATSSPLTLSRADETSVEALAEAIVPTRFIKLEDAGVCRFYRLVRVSIYPRAIHVSGLGHYSLQSVAFEIPFEQPVALPPPSPEHHDDRGFLPLLRRLVANPDGLTPYANRTLVAESLDEPGIHTGWPPAYEGDPGTWLRMTISEDNVYRLDASQLAAAAPSLPGVDLGGVRLFSRGEEIPTAMLEDAEGRPMLVFHGRASESEYSTGRAYWVHVPGGSERAPAPLRMQSLIGFDPNAETTPMSTVPIETVGEEEQILLIQSGSFLAITGHEWVWKELALTEPTTFEFELPFPDPTQETLNARLRFVRPDQPRIKTEAWGEGLQAITFSSEHTGFGFQVAGKVSLAMSLNGKPAATIEVLGAGLTEAVTSVTLAMKDLRPGVNTLALELANGARTGAEYSGVFFDRIEIDHRRALMCAERAFEFDTPGENAVYRLGKVGADAPLVLDVTDPEQPLLERVQPLQRGAPGQLSTFAFGEKRAGRRLQVTHAHILGEVPPLQPPPDPVLTPDAQSADYVIVYHDRFREQVERLADFHRRQGRSVLSVDAEELYVRYTAGEMSPVAIKAFLADALRRWPIPPTTVCLFGDASSDYRGALRSGVENLLPAYSYKADADSTWASEIWFTNVAGDDLLPDLVLGRIPARLVEDADEMVRKTITYAETPPLGPWRARLGYCADDDPGDAFREALEKIASDYRPRALGARRIYIQEFPYVDNFYLPRDLVRANNLKFTTAASAELLDTLNRGVAMMLYMGHGSPNIWTDERLWFGGDSENSDNLKLRNGDRLPFVATFTCNHGAFDYPMPPWHISISEDMMRVRKGGCVGLFVPSGPGTTPEHERVARPLLESVFADGFPSMGEAATLTRLKYCLENRHGSHDMARMFVYLGDPALDLAMPEQVVTGRAEPSILNPELGERDVSLQADIPDLEEGRFVASLYDADDRHVLSSPPLPFSNGRISWNCSLPEPAAIGQWTLRAYYGSDDARRDGAVWAPVTVSRPALSVLDFHLNGEPAAIGQATSLTLTVRNDGGAPARETPVRAVAIEAPSQSRTVLLDEMLELGPGQSRVFNLNHTVASPLTVFKASVEEWRLPLDDSRGPEDAERLLTLQVPDGATTRVLSSPLLVEKEWQHGARDFDVTLTVPLHHSGVTRGVDGTAILRNAQGKRQATSHYLLRGSASGRPNVDHVRLRLRNLTLAETQHPLVLDVWRPGEAPSEGHGGQEKPQADAEPLLSMEIVPGTPDIYDLAIEPGSLSFDPPVPVDGESVFAHMTVKNRGRSKSPGFRARTYSTRGNQPEKPLEAVDKIPQPHQGPLGAGQARRIVTRWDPPSYGDEAGTQTIRVTLDPDMRNADLEPENNEVREQLRILSRPEVGPADVNLTTEPLPDGGRRAKVVVTVRNYGEAPARDRYLGIFRKEPETPENFLDPEYLLHRRELPPVPGLGAIEAVHTWNLEPGEALTTPTAQVFQITRTIGFAEGMDLDEDEGAWAEW